MAWRNARRPVSGVFLWTFADVFKGRQIFAKSHETVQSPKECHSDPKQMITPIIKTSFPEIRYELEQLDKRAGHTSVLASILAGEAQRQRQGISNMRELLKRATFKEDGWYQIEKRGQRKDPTTGDILIFDDQNIPSIVADFNRSAEVPGFCGMPIKFPGDEGLVSAPAGRAMRLEARPDGIFAFIVWERPTKQADPPIVHM